MRRLTSLARGWLVVMLTLAASTATAAAEVVPAPVGPAPIRYRDVIFPSLAVTPAMTCGSAPDQNGNPVCSRYRQ